MGQAAASDSGAPIMSERLVSIQIDCPCGQTHTYSLWGTRTQAFAASQPGGLQQITLVADCPVLSQRFEHRLELPEGYRDWKHLFLTCEAATEDDSE